MKKIEKIKFVLNRYTDYYCFNIDSYYIKHSNLYVTIYVGSKDKEDLNDCLELLKNSLIRKFNFKINKETNIRTFKSHLINYKIYSKKVYLIGNKNTIERILNEYKKNN